MFGLKQRSTYEEIINHVKSQEEQRVSLPNRVASIIHNSVKYQSFINEHLNDLEEQQNKSFKPNILQNEIKQQKGVGNHQVNIKTFDMTKDDDDGNYDTPFQSRQSSGDGNYLTPIPPTPPSEISETISSVTDEEERKKNNKLNGLQNQQRNTSVIQ